ncbi:hypothetical protein D9M70_452590 [compost metagenome]
MRTRIACEGKSLHRSHNLKLQPLIKGIGIFGSTSFGLPLMEHLEELIIKKQTSPEFNQLSYTILDITPLHIMCTLYFTDGFRNHVKAIVSVKFKERTRIMGCRCER